MDSPWFDLIELELSEGNCPNSPYTDLYQEYERKMHKLSDILCRRDEEYRVFDGDDLMHRTVCRNKSREEIESASTPALQPKSGKTWVCPSCGTETNSKKFCANCGAVKPGGISCCANCGWECVAGQTLPKFCPECGRPIR